jgi:asparagine synthase (glutamine-hydrolysing)
VVPGIALDREMYFEAKTFLHGLLVVEDKISSAHALEARVPFLDDDLVDYSLSLPADYKLNLQGLLGSDPGALNGAALQSSDGKYVLRAAMEGLLPEEILQKKKQGFSTPDDSWYRGGAPGYIRDIILSPRALERGYFRAEYIEKMLDEHVEGRKNHRLLIWSLLSFEWWNRIFVDGDRGHAA